MENSHEHVHISNILKSARTIAVIGMSRKPDRISHDVGTYLKRHGYTVIPVNPNYSNIDGATCYPSLADIPSEIPVDVVNIFRKSEDVFPVVKEALKRGVLAVWMQEGIINNEAAALARSRDILTIMDRCIKREHEVRNCRRP